MSKSSISNPNDLVVTGMQNDNDPQHTAHFTTSPEKGHKRQQGEYTDIINIKGAGGGNAKKSIISFGPDDSEKATFEDQTLNTPKLSNRNSNRNDATNNENRPPNSRYDILDHMQEQQNSKKNSIQKQHSPYSKSPSAMLHKSKIVYENKLIIDRSKDNLHTINCREPWVRKNTEAASSPMNTQENERNTTSSSAENRSKSNNKSDPYIRRKNNQGTINIEDNYVPPHSMGGRSNSQKRSVEADHYKATLGIHQKDVLTTGPGQYPYKIQILPDAMTGGGSTTKSRELRTDTEPNVPRLNMDSIKNMKSLTSTHKGSSNILGSKNSSVAKPVKRPAPQEKYIRYQRKKQPMNGRHQTEGSNLLKKAPVDRYDESGFGIRVSHQADFDNSARSRIRSAGSTPGRESVRDKNKRSMTQLLEIYSGKSNRNSTNTPKRTNVKGSFRPQREKAGSAKPAPTYNNNTRKRSEQLKVRADGSSSLDFDTNLRSNPRSRTVDNRKGAAAGGPSSRTGTGSTVPNLNLKKVLQTGGANVLQQQPVNNKPYPTLKNAMGNKYMDHSTKQKYESLLMKQDRPVVKKQRPNSHNTSLPISGNPLSQVQKPRTQQYRPPKSSNPTSGLSQLLRPVPKYYLKSNGTTNTTKGTILNTSLDSHTNSLSKLDISKNGDMSRLGSNSYIRNKYKIRDDSSSRNNSVSRDRSRGNDSALLPKTIGLNQRRASSSKVYPNKQQAQGGLKPLGKDYSMRSYTKGLLKENQSPAMRHDSLGPKNNTTTNKGSGNRTPLSLTIESENNKRLNNTTIGGTSSLLSKELDISHTLNQSKSPGQRNNSNTSLNKLAQISKTQKNCKGGVIAKSKRPELWKNEADQNVTPGPGQYETSSPSSEKRGMSYSFSKEKKLGLENVALLTEINGKYEYGVDLRKL